MTSNNLCSSCTNIGCEFQSGIVRTECAFYMSPHIESDNCGNYVVIQPTVNVLGKIRAEIDKIYEREGSSFDCLNALDELKEFIDKLQAESEVSE